MNSLSDQADQIIYKIHLAHCLLMAQYDEIQDIIGQHGYSCTGCEFNHYHNQLSALNVIVDNNLTSEADKLEKSLERYDRKKIHRGSK